MEKFRTRLGDGSIVFMTAQEIKDDIKAGVDDATSRGEIPPLTQEEMDYIFEVVTMPGNVVGVKYGMEVVSTSDSGSDKIGAKCCIPVDRTVQAMLHEKILGCDSVDIGFRDYNYKTAKGVADHEAAATKNAMERTTMPIFYGAMPNLGFYTYPDGPVDNWAVLLPEGKIKEAMKAQEDAIEHCVRDIVYVAEQMNKVGVDAMNFDTSGAAGDADFLASLKACEEVKKQFPDIQIELGMAGEFVLGMHGKLKYDGVRLAGLYPHQQVLLAEKAGASIFGAVVNTNCNMSFPWNIARVCTFMKACTAAATIPVHANVGMGVCGIPMCEIIATDTVSRADKLLVEIGKIDGFQIGVGDPFATEATHAMTMGMQGIRTAGDLVMRVMLQKKWKIDACKKYVAEKLGVEVIDLADVITMTDVRTNLGLGVQQPFGGENTNYEAKFRIAEVLDIKINCIERFKERAGLNK